MSLKDNLIKSMQSSAAWVALADALAVVIDQVVEPTLMRLKARPRLFDMHPDDVKVLFDELGANATIGRSEVPDRPLLLLQRLDEVHQKNYLYPLKKTLQREFNNVRVAWKPLFAPKDLQLKPYGTVLAREADKGLYLDVPEDGWFKTSRGVLQINLSDIYALYPGLFASDVMERFVAEVDLIIRPLLPTRIVYDGQLFVLQVETQDVIDTLKYVGSDLDITLMSAVTQPMYRIGKERLGTVRIGDDYDHTERRYSASSMLNFDFGSLYPRKPIRLGLDRIGAKRLGVNQLPPDVRFKSFTRTTN